MIDNTVCSIRFPGVQCDRNIYVNSILTVGIRLVIFATMIHTSAQIVRQSTLGLSHERML